MNKIQLATIILLLLSFLPILAQKPKPHFTQITGSSGITLGKINAVTQDKYGFMWFSDQTNRCIVRYDGSHMIRYENDPKNVNSLGGYYPECLFADSTGILWIGFYGMGLDRFDPVMNTFTHYRHDPDDAESLANDFVTAIHRDHTGALWIGNYGGLNRLNEESGTFDHFAPVPGDANSLSDVQVRTIYEDSEGTLWIGTGFAFQADSTGGLNRFERETETFTRFMYDPNDENSLAHNAVRSILEDSQGNFWIGTKGEEGLQLLDRKTENITRFPNTAKSVDFMHRPPQGNSNWDHITFLTEDTEENIWIGTQSAGINYYNPQTKHTTFYSVYNPESNFPDNSGWAAYPTKDGLVWISTQEANLYKVDLYNNIIPFYSLEGGITDWLQDEESLLATTNQGVYRTDLSTNKQTLLIPGDAWRLIADNKGNYWVTVDNLLKKYDAETESVMVYGDGQSGVNFTPSDLGDIYEDPDGLLWITSFGGGLFTFDPSSDSVTNYVFDPADTNSISSNLIFAMYGDEDIWLGLGENRGVNRIYRKTGQVKRYLASYGVFDLMRDGKGVLWAGTTGGLFSYDELSDQFINVNEEIEEGFVNAVLRGITEDHLGNLWMSSFSGILMLNPYRDQAITFGKENGVETERFYFGSAYTGKDGKIYIGEGMGYYAFYPEDLTTVPGELKIYCTDFWLDAQPISPDPDGPLKQSIYDTKEISLAYHQNAFGIGFTSIDYRGLERNQVYYQLENYDPDWIRADAGDRANYFRVPPGKYVFKVKGSDSSNGKWTEKRIAIRIALPWWRTWWAYGLYAILFGCGVFLIDRYQRRRLIAKERARAQAKELEQAKEIEKAYHELKKTQTQLIHSEKMASLGELTAGIAHEIQNPLNFVNNFSEINAELIKEMKEEINQGNLDEVKSIADNIELNEEKINHHGKRADSIVKNMLMHSRNSSDGKEHTDINVLADEYLRLAYHGMRARDKSFNANMETHFDGSLHKVEIIPQEIGRVLLNIITNAFHAVMKRKAESENGYQPEVNITTRNLKDGLEIRIKDNGWGIPDNIKDKVFQPFFTTKPSGQGTGLGLSLSYDIVKAHGGDIALHSQEGEGTEFIIKLPVQAN